MALVLVLKQDKSEREMERERAETGEMDGKRD